VGFPIYLMKKLLVLMLIGMFVLSFGFASAKTYITGKVYDATDPSWPEVYNATVNVTCTHGSVPISDVTYTDSEGTYAFEFLDAECDFGDTISIIGFKEGIGQGIGDGNEVSIDMPGISVNIGVSNVPLVPEFGVVVGLITMLSAVGIFFMVRRE